MSKLATAPPNPLSEFQRIPKRSLLFLLGCSLGCMPLYWMEDIFRFLAEYGPREIPGAIQLILILLLYFILPLSLLTIAPALNITGIAVSVAYFRNRKEYINYFSYSICLALFLLHVINWIIYVKSAGKCIGYLIRAFTP